MKMEEFPKKLKNIGLAAVAAISSITAKSEDFGNKNHNIIDSIDKKKEISITENTEDLNSKTFNLSGGEGGLENKDYRIDTIEVTEKNGQKYVLLKLTKIKGKYSSYQEVIQAIQDINPSIKLLTPEETRNFLNENKSILSKRPYYVALGTDVTGGPIDIKAANFSGIKFNTYKFDNNGTILISGSSSPYDNDYIFPARIKTKITESKLESE